MSDREQAREDACYLRSFHDEAKWWPIADRIDALLAELEQAETRADFHERAAKQQHNWVHRLEDELEQAGHETEAFRLALSIADERAEQAESQNDRECDISSEYHVRIVRLEARLAEADALAEALRTTDAEASVAHDAIWSPDTQGIGGAGIGILHDSERNDSANSAIWRLHKVARAALAAWEQT